ncbi:MAG: putative ABC transport system permease protein [Cyclobacteriaceae bacterium]
MAVNQDIKPPTIWLKLLRWFCRKDLIEDIEGDLTELFYFEAASSQKIANRYFRTEVLRLIRPRILRSFKTQNFQIMLFKNYLKTAWRNAKMYRGYSSLNLFGLIVGISAAMFIYLWIADEEQVDQFHINKDRLVAVKRNMAQSDGLMETTSNIPHPLAAVLQTEYPEVVTVTEVSRPIKSLLKLDESNTMEAGIFVSENFFETFSFPIIIGTPINDDDLSGILISEVLAEKYLKPEEKLADLIGQSLLYEQEETVVIQGIFDSKYGRSSMEMDWVRPAKSFIDQAEWMQSWENGAFNIFALLVDETKVAAVNERIVNEIETHTDRTNGETLWVQPFSNTYLHGQYENGTAVGGKIRYVSIMKIVAILILVIACINFMNLSTARASRRSKEIGLRKVMGAHKSMISKQFLFEAFLYTFFAAFVSLVIVFATLPWFNHLIDKQIALSSQSLEFWLYITITILVTSFLAGSYPAIRLAGINLVKAMKGDNGSDKGAVYVRKVLVIFQVGVSFILLFGAILVHHQIEYLLTKDTGLNRDYVAGVYLRGALKGQFDTYKQELLGISGVVEVAGLSGNPVNYGRSTSSAKWDGQDPNTPYEVGVMVVSGNFLNMMDVKILEGEKFGDGDQPDSMRFVVNKAAVQMMGFTEPIGKKLSVWGMSGRIIGVADNFNVSSLHKAVEPQIILAENQYVEMALIKVTPNASNIVEEIDRVTRQMNPGYPVAMEWLDDSYREQYETEIVMGKLSNLFVIVSVIIACLGLFGLSAYSTEKRTKEIGIRKVHGASSWQLVMLLAKDYVWLIVIALALAIPISYLQGAEWLSSFAYHIDLGAMSFIISGMMLLGLGCITVGFKSYTASRKNPIDTLRSE